MTTVEPPSHRYNREVKAHQAYVDNHARHDRSTGLLRFAVAYPLPAAGIVIGLIIAANPGWPYLVLGAVTAAAVAAGAALVQTILVWESRFSAWHLEWAIRRLEWLRERSAVQPGEERTDGLDAVRGHRAGRTAAVRSFAYAGVAAADATFFTSYVVLAFRNHDVGAGLAWIAVGVLMVLLGITRFWAYHKMTRAVDAVVHEARRLSG